MDADDGVAMGIAIGISDEAPSSVDGVTVVATTTGGAISGASRAGELPEGAAIEGKREEVTGGGARKLRWQGKVLKEEGCARVGKRDVSLKMRCGEALFKGCLKRG